jgi:hypothetical protein
MLPFELTGPSQRSLSVLGDTTYWIGGKKRKNRTRNLTEEQQRGYTLGLAGIISTVNNKLGR